MAKQFALVRNALLMPLQGSMDAFASGVFKDGVCLETSLHARGVASKPEAATKHLEGVYIFGGYLFRHYGHFLLESLSRLYAWRQGPLRPILFMTPNSDITDWQRHIFKALGIKNELRLVKAPTQVDSLIMSPEGSSVEPDFIRAEQIAALGCIDGGPPTPGKKIWISRSGFMQKYNAGGIVNENQVEAPLAAAGWDIVAPEMLHIRNQVSLFCSAEHVAGFDGSALFTALLARNITGKFTVFGRRNAVAGAIPYMLKQKGIMHDVHVPAVVELSGHGAGTLYQLSKPQEVTDILLQA